MIQQALRNSTIEHTRVSHDIPHAPTFRPTLEEFKNPLLYVGKIRSEAEKYGICKIVPPDGWNPPCQVDPSNARTFATKLQDINIMQEGGGFDEGKSYTMASYQEMADAFTRRWSETHYDGQVMSLEDLAKDYWDMVEMGTGFVTKRATVEYANDIDTLKYASGFPACVKQEDGQGGASNNHSGVESPDCPDMFSEDYYRRTGWNLTNLPTCGGSVLSHLQTSINGVNVPWLYIGMLFASFCWHNEDNYLYSINYNHFGAAKQWYGVPGAEAKNFEKVSKTFLAESFREAPDLLHHMTTQISPNLLYGKVPVYRLEQDAKTFIVTFPKAFHAGFSYGFNCGEAVNFATHDWLKGGSEADERYRAFARVSVFSHQRLLFTLMHNKTEIPPSALYDLLEEVRKVLQEDIASREAILQQGVRDISALVSIPPNNFERIDSRSCDYDDLRTCHACKHTCLLTAVACECDKNKVACVRHYNATCKCPKDKKYMLSKLLSINNIFLYITIHIDRYRLPITYRY